MWRTLWVLLLLTSPQPLLSGAPIRLRGRVVDETRVAVAGAIVTAREAAEPAAAAVAEAVADAQGTFSLALPDAGRYLLRAGKAGFFVADSLAIDASADEEVVIVLNHLREEHTSIEVAYSPRAIDPEQTAVRQTVTQADVLRVPYPSSHSLSNAMRVMPGAVVQDVRGQIHLNGGSANQIYWTLDGFNITDPLTGRFDSHLSVEAPRSLTLATGRYPAEYGKGSAGALAIETSRGDDEFRYSATNFFPGIENRKGLTIGDWRPRLNLSGPIARGRAWFSNSTDLQYNQYIVRELPKGSDRTASYRASNLLSSQVNLTSANILSGGFLATAVTAPLSGLGILDPRETTVDRRSRQYFLHVKNQHYFTRGVILEGGFASNRTFGREIPQGEGMYLLTPAGRRGNYFIDARRWATRDQSRADILLPALQWRGQHQFKAGIDLNRLEYRQRVVRTGYERWRHDGSPSARTLFRGSGAYDRSGLEAAWYWQNAWKPRPDLVLDFGMRQDWDSLVRDWVLSPRLAAAWSPWGARHTKLSGGYGVLYDASSLQLFTRHLDQHTVSTFFDAGGLPVEDGLITLFRLDGVPRRAPRYNNWTLGVDRQLGGGLLLQTNLLRKRGRDGFHFVDTLATFRPGLPPPERMGGERYAAVFALRNGRRDTFDSLEVTLRQTFAKQRTWLASYTRSRARSNAALDISVDNPVFISDNSGPMPWDAPHRLLTWGHFPLSENWAISHMVEWRSGLPYSVEDEDGRVLGGVNSRRLPDFLEVNLTVERRFTLLKRRWALRIGYVNLLDRQNPTLVQNNIASSHFGTFYGGTPRALITRIRWLGDR
jgi:hypothetical protein